MIIKYRNIKKDKLMVRLHNLVKQVQLNYETVAQIVN